MTVAEAPRAARSAGFLRLLRRLAPRRLYNPVLTKEFRSRMRGDRAYWVLLGYVLLLALVVGLVYAVAAGHTEMQMADRAARLGQDLYYYLFIGQAVLILLLAPAFVSGAITIEREQRTHEMLVASPLSAGEIVRGKLIAVVSFVVLLLTASLPLASISLLVGGVSPAAIVASYTALALSALLYCAIGLFWSAVARNTPTATALTYGTVIALFALTGLASATGGILFLQSAFTSPTPGWSTVPTLPFRSLNPIGAVFTALEPETFFTTQIPSWVNTFSLNLTLALGIIAATCLRLPGARRGNPAVYRLLGTVLWTLCGLFLVGGVFGVVANSPSPPPVSELTGSLFTSLLLGLLVLTAALATGTQRYQPGETPLRHYLKGLLPHRLLGDELANGAPLLALWFIIGVAMIVVGQGLTLPGSVWGAFQAALPAILVTGSALLAFGGLAQLLSVLMPTRFTAIAFVGLGAALTLAVPYGLLFTYEQSHARELAPILSVALYCTPLHALEQLREPIRFWSRHVPMALGTTPLWMVSTALSLAVAALSTLGVWLNLGVFAARRQRALEEADRRWMNPPDSKAAAD